VSRRIAVESLKKHALWYERGHSSDSISSRISKSPCIRRRHLPEEFLILLLVMIVAIGIIAYTCYHIDQLDRPVAIGIIVAAAAVALANAAMLGRLWRYKRRKPGCGSRGKQSARKITMDKAYECDFGYCSFHEALVSEGIYQWKGCWGCQYFGEGEDFPYRSVAQAASQLKKSESTIRLWIKKGKLDGKIFEQRGHAGSLPSARTYHILQESIDRLIAKGVAACKQERPSSDGYTKLPNVEAACHKATGRSPPVA